MKNSTPPGKDVDPVVEHIELKKQVAVVQLV